MEPNLGDKIISVDSKSFFEQQADFRILVDSIRDYGIFMMDPAGRILTWNKGAERIKGYSAGEVVGTHFTRFYTEADRTSGHPARELAVATQVGRYEDEGWRVRKDGTMFWANVIITKLTDAKGNHIGFGKVTRDLTERKQNELALKESEERFRLMVETAKDYAIIMLDTQGHIVSWNSGAERIKGWKAEEIIGRHFSNFYPPEDVRSGKLEMELSTAQREGRFEDYGWRVRKDGTKFWANVIISALRDEQGNLKGYSKVTRDITERKKAEEELKKAYTDLERRVEDRTRALIVSNQELESFSYSISHDLRAPLRSMDGFSQALLKYYDDKLDEKGKDYLKRIRESSQRMAQLIDDILNLSRLGRADLDKKEVDLSELVKSVAAELQKSEPGRKADFVITPGIVAYCDPGLMRAAFVNLLGNSWKYASRHPTTRIEFGSSRREGSATVVYFVKDDGAGFNMAFAEKLFSPFQRLHSESEFPGTGIGLASVKRIVNRHGGQVWAESLVEQGTTIYFTLEDEKAYT